MIIIVHTSKTMRPPTERTSRAASEPLLLHKTVELAAYLKTLSLSDIQKVMKVSEKLASDTYSRVQSWTSQPLFQREAIDSFLGDIYSGLQVASWSEQDRQYAQQHLRILSGLYGILRPLDGIYPYRLELGYKLPSEPYKNLYAFWGDAIAKTLAPNELIVDLSAVEYSKTFIQYVDAGRVITPRFLTVSPVTGEAVFVVVHAKIARGAFASWMVKNRVDDQRKLHGFSELGYEYDSTLSTQYSPVFVCKKFDGIGLSVRLS